MNASTASTQSQSISPLRQRMLEDMHMRKLGDKIQSQYIRAVCRLTEYLGRSPDSASAEDLRNYQLHLVNEGVSPATLNTTITGLRFFFEVTLGNPALMMKMKAVQEPRTLPVILSREEVARLIAACRNLKHHSALSLAVQRDALDRAVAPDFEMTKRHAGAPTCGRCRSAPAAPGR